VQAIAKLPTGAATFHQVIPELWRFATQVGEPDSIDLRCLAGNRAWPQPRITPACNRAWRKNASHL
jgi:hypothetical protein